jgi:hypothetical protein
MLYRCKIILFLCGLGFSQLQSVTFNAADLPPEDSVAPQNTAASAAAADVIRQMARRYQPVATAPAAMPAELPPAGVTAAPPTVALAATPVTAPAATAQQSLLATVNDFKKKQSLNYSEAEIQSVFDASVELFGREGAGNAKAKQSLLGQLLKKGKAGGKQPFELKLLSIEEQLRLGQIMSEAQTIIASSQPKLTPWQKRGVTKEYYEFFIDMRLDQSSGDPFPGYALLLVFLGAGTIGAFSIAGIKHRNRDGIYQQSLQNTLDELNILNNDLKSALLIAEDPDKAGAVDQEQLSTVKQMAALIQTVDNDWDLLSQKDILDQNAFKYGMLVEAIDRLKVLRSRLRSKDLQQKVDNCLNKQRDYEVPGGDQKAWGHLANPFTGKFTGIVGYPNRREELAEGRNRIKKNPTPSDNDIWGSKEKKAKFADQKEAEQRQLGPNQAAAAAGPSIHIENNIYPSPPRRTRQHSQVAVVSDNEDSQNSRSSVASDTSSVSGGSSRGTQVATPPTRGRLPLMQPRRR